MERRGGFVRQSGRIALPDAIEYRWAYPLRN
jgi:hypothetical protein